MNNDGRKATIRDVATVAGVSISSVSRVLNRIEPLSDELVRKVEAAVEDVGYHYSARKQNYSFSTVAVLIPDTSNLYFMEIINGIEDQARRLGYIVTIIVVTQNPDEKQKLLQWLPRSNLSGIIFCSSSGGGFTDADLHHLQNVEKIPVVLLNRRLPSPDFAGIQINFVDAMYRATKYILSLGHRRISILGRHKYSESANLKKEGIQKAFKEVGMRIEEDMYIEGLPTIEWGFHGTGLFLDRPPASRPTAIIGLDDLNAVGALHAIRHRGMRVPEDISVIGFDDIAMAAHSSPPLTTVAAPKYEMGALSVQILEQMKKNTSTVKIGSFKLMESPLIIRESTGACP
jgi:LacI family transcriptional regulator, galactose operon repressor